MDLLPANLLEKTNSGESAVRKAIFQQLNHWDGYALHSVGLSEHENKQYAEADFLIVCKMGVICLEVKGGEVIQRIDGTWEIGWQDTGKTYISSEGPFKQSQTVCSAIRRILRNKGLGKIPVFWGVVFPHCKFECNDPEWKPFHVCDIIKIKDFSGYLKNLFKENFAQLETLSYKKFEQSALSKDKLKQVKNVLRKDIQITWHAGNKVEQSKSDVKILEKTQEVFLDDFVYSPCPRLILRGGAGTGKTLLSVKAAELLCSQNKNGLFLVFNKLLKTQIENHFHGKSIIVATIYEFMKAYCENLPSTKTTKGAFFSELKDTFCDKVDRDILENKIKPFDFLIFDEAQDFFTEEIGRTLFELVDGGAKQGSWLICLDEEVQSDVYGNYSSDFIQKLETQVDVFIRHLYRNYRNPKPIAECANKLYPNQKLAVPSRDFKSYPNFKTFEHQKDELKTLRNEVTNLLKQGVSFQDITVLTFSSQKSSNLHELTEISGISFTSEKIEDKAIYWHQIGAFKGLENEVIIVTEVPMGALDKRRAEYFVALTRTRTDLIVICHKNTKIWEI